MLISFRPCFDMETIIQFETRLVVANCYRKHYTAFKMPAKNVNVIHTQQDDNHSNLIYVHEHI